MNRAAARWEHDHDHAAIRERLAEGGIGALKSCWPPRPWWRSALETLGIGGGAAAIAYGIGAWLRGLAG